MFTKPNQSRGRKLKGQISHEVESVTNLFTLR